MTPRRFLVAGSSGFLGSRLTAHLREAGHEVHRLVRSRPDGSDASTWDPYAGRLDTALVDSADVVVNLAGAPIAGNPHSRRWARAVLESRVITTAVLAQAIAAADRRPVFLAQNGMSFYGDHGEQVLTEDSDSRGASFLTGVARAWQAATEPAATAGSRVLVLRSSPVVDRSAAPLRQLVPLFRLGLGARLGDGRQYFPLISLRDWLDAVTFLADGDVDTDAGPVSGPVNLCCPHTPTNGEFTDALAAAVGRRARLAAPAPVLRRAAGRMAPEVLGSMNARPDALLRAGYEFRDPGVREVLATALA